ncbi:ArsR family transcriptional regulator [Devosia limi DSM 17137]|uniref:ArsR family transcriptional regulator n=2 Tax=Devosia TaxID=46913 RepID=A0A0F5LX47_9HYPH|nr:MULTISPECIES: metalloregulator ArsR/SmtB family transcription factor [Devosia]MBU1334405.1 metalloregulator ArsR/SmtB family transcription factor [Alphaproteobacteria bacterium]KFL27556.1 ArsR family transcriptional regulator [Devosia riboflavina]KKB86212.1 ArsR family transcriptional regulator [Devosia limi DSM 17137]MBU1559749.1 metalloregulator ArsR/SmtB family transcription factor [Alphaproteobacteria bacterium]MBU2305128.1 metalloregulator ArsR/SmtB family transcription factor [Alphapr
MSSPSPKLALFEQFALVAKTLGHPQRLELIEQLGQGPRSVDLLAEKLGSPIANVSQHLQTMRRAGLVAAERQGKYVVYRLADASVLAAMQAIQRVAENNLAEVDKIVRGYFEQRDSLEPITRDELSGRLRDGMVTVLDVRPADEFALGHVPGALNVPLAELDACLTTLDPEKDIVAYCRGAYCVMSFEAVSRLRAQGFRARRLEDGMPQWAAAGNAVAS